MMAALARHNELAVKAIADNNGAIFKSLGDGYCCAFEDPADAVQAAFALERAVLDQTWQTSEPLRVRIAIHTGPAEKVEGDFFGPALNRCARLLGLAGPGQVLVSESVERFVSGYLSEDLSLTDLGVHRLRDLVRPERIFQLTHPLLPLDFPPLAGGEGPEPNLPVQTSSFIGRGAELDEIGKLLLHARLVTLTGAGGVGKTRLAIEAGQRAIAFFEHGVFWCDLASLADPAAIDTEVASALGLSLMPDQNPRQETLRAIGERHALLIMDNCEHLVGPCSEMVEELLTHARHLAVLATSREVFNMDGEVAWRVPGLSAPDSQGRLTESEAAQLFVERARAANSQFRLTETNGPAVARICRELDGMPLALELAASRIKVFTPEQIADRLSDRLNLLTLGKRHGRPRHQTLRAAIEWSHDLLSEEERAAYRKLSVFAGGFSLRAAEALLGDATIAADMVTQLVDKSILTVEERRGEARYRMLETIRAFGQERLADFPDAADCCLRHAQIYREIVRSVAPRISAESGSDWLEVIDRDLDNIRAALAWGAENDPAESLRLAVGMADYWDLRGLDGEGRRALAKHIEAVEEIPHELMADALASLGRLELAQGAYEECEAHLTRCLALSREHGLDKTAAQAWNNLGNLEFIRGNFSAAEDRYRQSLELRQAAGDRPGMSASYANLANIARLSNDFERCREYSEASLAIDRELGDQKGVASTQGNLGLAALSQGRSQEARDYFNESLIIRRRLGDRQGISIALHNLALSYQYDKQLDEARPLYAESLAIRRDIGDRQGVALLLCNYGYASLESGDAVAAETQFKESLGTFRELNAMEGILAALEGIALAAKAVSQTAAATRILGCVSVLREEHGIPLPPNEQEQHKKNLEELRKALGKSYEAEWVAGRTSSLPQIVSFAMG